MSGKIKFNKAVIKAIIKDTTTKNDGRSVYARTIIIRHDKQYYAYFTGHRGLNILTSLVAADGLVVILQDKPLVKSGDLVVVIMLDWNEE